MDDDDDGGDDDDDDFGTYRTYSHIQASCIPSRNCPSECAFGYLGLEQNMGITCFGSYLL